MIISLYNQYETLQYIALPTHFDSVTQACSLTPTVTFGQIGEVNTGFLQQVNYDERDWLFGASTTARDEFWGTGPLQDNTEEDTNGLFAYINRYCGPQFEDEEACEGERVLQHTMTYALLCFYRQFLKHLVFHLDQVVCYHLLIICLTVFLLMTLTLTIIISLIWACWKSRYGMEGNGMLCSMKEEETMVIFGIVPVLTYR